MYKKTLFFLIEILKNEIFSSPRFARRRKISQTNFLKIIIKKYIFLHFLIIFSLFPFQKGNAFLDGDFWIDIYTMIDENFESYEGKLFEYDLTRQWEKTITENLNNSLQAKWLNPCIKEWLDTETLFKIYNQNMEALYSVMKPECLTKDGSISFSNANNYTSEIWTFYDVIKSESKKKMQNIYMLSRLWLYSDGNTDNSPFDLVSDVEEIEKIIFSQELEYNGKQTSDFEEDFESLINGLLWIWESDETENEETTQGKENDDWDDWTIWEKEQTEETQVSTPSLPPLILSPGSYSSNYVCSEDTYTMSQASGLDESVISTLLAENFWYNDTNWDSGTNNGNDGTNSDWDNTGWDQSTQGERSNYSNTGYQKVNDNSVWNCDSFFCIEITFEIYNQKLLGGWKDTQSIEYIINRSNEHLKKFVNTSLVQSKMTTDNFELGLMDLNLPDLFHNGVVIQRRSPPILNLEDKIDNGTNTNNKDKSQDTGNFSSESLFEETYKNIGLNYKKQNSIAQFLWKQKERTNVQALAELSQSHIARLIEDMENAEKKYEQSPLKNGTLEKTTEELSLIDDQEILFREFLELEKFSDSLRDYVFHISAVIEQMNEIPIRD